MKILSVREGAVGRLKDVLGAAYLRPEKYVQAGSDSRSKGGGGPVGMRGTPTQMQFTALLQHFPELYRVRAA